MNFSVVIEIEALLSHHAYILKTALPILENIFLAVPTVVSLIDFKHISCELKCPIENIQIKLVYLKVYL